MRIISKFVFLENLILHAERRFFFKKQARKTSKKKQEKNKNKAKLDTRVTLKGLKLDTRVTQQHICIHIFIYMYKNANTSPSGAIFSQKFLQPPPPPPVKMTFCLQKMRQIEAFLTINLLCSSLVSLDFQLLLISLTFWTPNAEGLAYNLGYKGLSVCLSVCMYVCMYMHACTHVMYSCMPKCMCMCECVHRAQGHESHVTSGLPVSW